MSIHVALNHRTSYQYNRPIMLGPQVVRLRPAPHCRTSVISYALKVQPADHFINWQQDPHGNWLARLVFPKKTDRFSIEVDLVADMAVVNPFDFFLEPEAENWPFDYPEEAAADLAPYRRCDPAGPLLTAFLQSISREEVQTVTFLSQLNLRLQQEIAYTIRMEPGVQTPEETLEKKLGSCRDTGWLLVQVLRHLGFAARFVSGYLIQLKPDQVPLDGPAGPTDDFTDLHAWTEVYLPGAGWVGLDPTSGLFAGEGHLPLAATPEPSSAAPVSGLVEPAETEFDFAMSVTRIAETPRVTKPYDDASWEAIKAAGDAVDERLMRGDVRLTMGGEPTFVSIDDRDGAEWNTAALGPEKRRLSGRLIRRLAEAFADRPLLHYGQGKWYPGEPLPRWALTCIWRKDGEPLWQDISLLADDETPARATVADAERFASTLAARLGVGATAPIPAHEDIHHLLWQERRLPVNVDPRDAKLARPEERERLARLFEGNPGRVVGYVLPLGRQGEGVGRRWISGPWFQRGDYLFLIPGDSPLGFRLPLETLPYASETDFPYHYPADPMSPPTGPLPEPVGGSSRIVLDHESWEAEGWSRPAVGTSDKKTIRTALCVEPREGVLRIFLPPTETGDDFVHLISAIEGTAAELELKIMIEGYGAPSDPRLQEFSVTPDPGVIEVNIHPAGDWRALVERTETIYAAAEAERLTAEKFMIDGRHVGTGGGNHMVVGGPTAPDSPFLRRPDLLRSMVTYWLNHPSLSYLFSGLFIGPTSQHPRVDEGRNDAVYELEIANRQVPEPGSDAPLWLVDRLYRNLLTDLTGNTHRAEFCIDKLFSPDSSSGRRGLLELRGFEMPPHARMSVAQQLLIRSLIAWFWETPYRARPTRWGTRLAGPFMLPHFIQSDLDEVVSDLKSAGFQIESAWFAPHMAFRFPEIGSITRSGVSLTLHQALEPWHVLGEEPGGGGTVRFVDSSVERLQVRVTGLVEGRHIISCNGTALPLVPTGTVGEGVAGLRFRAWQPPSCLHPTIPVQAPLVFDIYDSWSGRSLGGCTYRVSHPGGRNYDTLPVNANEAEARRRARFETHGHHGGPSEVPKPAPSPEYPATLDLRWVATG